INMPKAWDVTEGKGVIVAVLDTGIAYEDYQDFKQVPDLKGVKFVKGYDFVNNDTHANDDHGHGPHVAGTIAQATNNKEGVTDIAAPGGDKSGGEQYGVLQNTIDLKDYTKSVYAYYQGTSMATPHVAGVAALLFAAGAKDPDAVEKALFASAKPPSGAKGWTEQ